MSTASECAIVSSINASITPGLMGIGEELERVCFRVLLTVGVQHFLLAYGEVDVCVVSTCGVMLVD